MMTAESTLSKRPVLRFTVALFSSHSYGIPKFKIDYLSYLQKNQKQTEVINIELTLICNSNGKPGKE